MKIKTPHRHKGFATIIVLVILLSMIRSSNIIPLNPISSEGEYSEVDPPVNVDLGDIVDETQSPLEDMGNLTHTLKDSVTDLGSLNQYTEDPPMDLGSINPTTEDDLNYLWNINHEMIDSYELLAISNTDYSYTYTNPEDEVSVMYQISDPMVGVEYTQTFTIPEDSLSMVVTGNWSGSSGFVNVTYEGVIHDENMGYSSWSPFTISFPTISADSDTSVLPGEDITVRFTFSSATSYVRVRVFSIRNYTYTNPDDEISIYYNINAPASSSGMTFGTRYYVQRVVFQIPHDAISVNIEGNIPSSMHIDCYYNDYISLFSRIGGSPFGEVIITSLGDPDSNIQPGDIVFLDLFTGTQGDSADFFIQSTRNYTYYNASDQLAVEYSATTIATISHSSFATIERFIFTIPEDASSFYVSCSAPSTIHTRVYRLSDDSEFHFDSGDFSLAFSTYLGDPLSSVYGGEVFVIDTRGSTENDVANYEVRAIRNYTIPQSQPITEMGYSFSFTSPADQNSAGSLAVIEQVVITVPEDTLLFHIHGELDSTAAFFLYSSDRTLLYSEYLLQNFEYWSNTTLADSLSDVEPGDILYLECHFSEKGVNANVTVYSYHEYGYSPTEEDIGLEGSFISENENQIYQIRCAVPENASQLIFTYSSSASTRLILYNTTGFVFFDSVISGTDWFRLNTTLLDNSSPLVPEDILIFYIEFENVGDILDFQIYSVQIYELPISENPVESWRIQFDLGTTAHLYTTRRIVLTIPQNTLNFSVFSSQMLYNWLTIQNENGTYYLIDHTGPMNQIYHTSLVYPEGKIDPGNILYFDIDTGIYSGLMNLDIQSLELNTPPDVWLYEFEHMVGDNLYRVHWASPDTSVLDGYYEVYLNGMGVDLGPYTGLDIITYEGNSSDLQFGVNNWTLVVYDGLGGTNRSEFFYDPPSPIITTDPSTTVLEQEKIQFNVSKAQENDPWIGNPEFSYTWDFDDGDHSSIRDPMHQFDVSGEYNVSVTIWDTDSDFTTISQVITVMNDDPNVNFDTNATHIYVNESVQFTDWTTEGNLPYSYNWSFGDGSYSDLQNPIHKFTSEGDYTVVLNVTDSDGDSDESSVIISVSLAPLTPEPPYLHAITPAISTTGNISLSWDSIDNAITYNIYRHTEPITDISGATLIGFTTNTYFNDKGLVNGTYYYVITSVGVSGESDPSNEESCSVEIPPNNLDPDPTPTIAGYAIGIFLGISGLGVALLIRVYQKKLQE